MEFGFESYLTAIALYPETMHKLFRYSSEEARLLNTVRVELVKQNQLPPFFFTGQDICGGTGPMVSPNTRSAIYFPNLRHALEPLVEIDAEIIWHSDGYIIPIVDPLIACGVSGFQGFQEETGFDIGEIAARQVRSGRKPLLLAGLSVDKTLPYGTVADVKKEVERIIDTVGLGGGLAIGTANTAGPDCPNENLEALYRHTHHYGRDSAQYL
jgi:uroporphyrinogen decarboxylase